MGKGLDFDQLFPGRFMKSGEFQGRDVTLRIRGIRTEKLPQEGGGERLRGIIAFDGTEKELVLNRTNGEAIKALFGRDTGEWIGKRVTFWPAPHIDNFTGEKGTAIRVRGSPDIQRDVTFSLKLARKKPVNVTLRRTGQTNGKPAQNGQAKQPPPPTPPPEPEASADPDAQPPEDLVLPGEEGHDATTGEVQPEGAA